MLRFFLRGSLSSDKVLKTGLNLFEVVILSLFIFLTFLFASLLPVDQDSVNFVLGIEEYNPLIHQPHFPGYPVYIFLGKVFASLFGSAEKGAVCLSIFSGALSILLLIRLLMQHFERSTADLCGALFSLNLVFFEFAHKIFSEIPALALLLFAITVLGNPQAASRKRWVVSLLFLGMLLGVRLSWWPFVPAYLLSGIWNKRGRPAFIGFGLGILVWFIPQAFIIGGEAFLLSGLSFVYGHFTKWGGAVGSLFEKENRVFLFGKQLAEASGLTFDASGWLQAPWVFLVLAGVSLSCVQVARRVFVNQKNSHKEERERFSLCQYSVGALNRQYPLFFLSLLGYLVWVFFGQNPDKVRHVIPVIPFLIVIVAPAVEIFEKRVWIVLLCISVSLLSNFVGRDSPVGPPEQFRRWILSENFSDATFFCGPTERYFDLYPVRQSVVSVPSVDELSGAINGSWPETKRNFVCDDIPGYAGEKKPVQVFPKRKGDPADISLKIYELL